MKSILFFFCCLCLPVFAETIGNVDYHLPQEIANEWEIVFNLENQKGTTLVYIPKSTEKQDAQEFFGVNSNNLSSNLEDVEAFKKELNKMFPDKQLDLSVLEKTENSVLFEWSATADGEEKIHGWSRLFSTPEGTVLLSYQTENIPYIPKARTLWLPILKEAHLIQSQ